jgi:hypothetical protein
VHTTLPGRFGRGQDCDNHTHPNQGDMVSAADYLCPGAPRARSSGQKQLHDSSASIRQEFDHLEAKAPA